MNTMASAIDVFTRFYPELTKVLPMIMDNLVTKLYSYKLLSGDQKDNIGTLTTDKEKITYLLDKVIKPALEIKCTKHFDEILRIMKNSDVYAVKYLFKEIQNFMQPESMSVDEKPAATTEGNYDSVVHTVILYVDQFMYSTSKPKNTQKVAAKTDLKRGVVKIVKSKGVAKTCVDDPGHKTLW